MPVRELGLDGAARVLARRPELTYSQRQFIANMHRMDTQEEMEQERVRTTLPRPSFAPKLVEAGTRGSSHSLSSLMALRADWERTHTHTLSQCLSTHTLAPLE